jgi:hypothetical protein
MYAYIIHTYILYITHHVYELREAQPHLDGKAVRVVAHGPDEPIVVAQQVVVQPLRFRVGHGFPDHRQKESQ